MNSVHSLTIARLFAAALDRSEFDAAARYLAPDCRYQIGGELLIGPDAIIASYRESDEWGKRALDQVLYESQVEQTGGDLSVLFADRITHHGETHEYRCRQHLWLDDAGLIARILHEELPGERASLTEFFARCRIRR
jgi:hypothetical protein